MIVTYSNHNFEDFIENGGYLIECQVKDIEAAIFEWKEYYLMLKKGFARVAYWYNDYKYINNYEQAEAHVQKNQVVIWPIPNYVNEKTNGFDMSVVH